jgi:hypothetical protein
VTSGGIRCSKGTQIIRKPNPSLFIKGGTMKEGKKQKSWYWTNIWPWVPAGLDARSDHGGWLPAVNYCSATKQLAGRFRSVNMWRCKMRLKRWKLLRTEWRDWRVTVYTRNSVKSNCNYELSDCNKTNYQAERRLQWHSTPHLVIESGHQYQNTAQYQKGLGYETKWKMPKREVEVKMRNVS